MLGSKLKKMKEMSKSVASDVTAIVNEKRNEIAEKRSGNASTNDNVTTATTDNHNNNKNSNNNGNNTNSNSGKSGKGDKDMEAILSRARITLHDYVALMSKPENCKKKNKFPFVCGIAIMSAVSGGIGAYGYDGTTGIVLNRLDNGDESDEKGNPIQRWSKPCAIGGAGITIGAHVGGSKADRVVFMTHPKHVESFINYGFESSAEATIGNKTGQTFSAKQSANVGAEMISFSFKGKGLMAGVKVLGKGLKAKKSTNRTFYGTGQVTTRDILLNTADFERYIQYSNAPAFALCNGKNEDYNTIICTLIKEFKHTPSLDNTVKNKRNQTPLMSAFQKRDEYTINLLMNDDNVRLVDKSVNGVDLFTKWDEIDYCVKYGDISIFQQFVLKWMKDNGIKNWSNIETFFTDGIGLKTTHILTKEKFHVLMKIAQKNKASDMVLFLKLILQMCINKPGGNFEMLINLLEKYKPRNVSQLIVASHDQFRQDQFIASYLVNRCEKNTLEDINNVINEGLRNIECGFNDSLLFLAKRVNSKRLSHSVQFVANKCLSNELKNDYNYLFFKNNMLNSNIWGMREDVNLNRDHDRDRDRGRGGTEMNTNKGNNAKTIATGTKNNASDEGSTNGNGKVTSSGSQATGDNGKSKRLLDFEKYLHGVLAELQRATRVTVGKLTRLSKDFANVKNDSKFNIDKILPSMQVLESDLGLQNGKYERSAMDMTIVNASKVDDATFDKLMNEIDSETTGGGVGGGTNGRVNNSNTDGGKSDTTVLLFNKVYDDVLLKELKLQKTYIKNEIVKLEKDNKYYWDLLRNSIKNTNMAIDGNIQQCSLLLDDENDIMADKGIQPDYNYDDLQLIYDNVNGFDASKEYDHNGYLSKLLIESYKLDPMFQEQCSKIFDHINTKCGIKCKYNSAPVKTKARTRVKADLDYAVEGRNWPYVSNVIDFLRCSVVFDDIKNLTDGINKFMNIVGTSNVIQGLKGLNVKMQQVAKLKNLKGISGGCLKRVVRIKNGFGSIPDESWNVDLLKFDYADIKLNVVIENEKENVRLIGEIQFLLSFMLEAKKKGHSIYGFVRKQDYFEQMYQISSRFNKATTSINDSTNFEIIQFIDKMILSRNMFDFSAFFQNWNQQERKFMFDNKEYLLNSLESSKWKKGKKLFEYVLKQHQS